MGTEPDIRSTDDTGERADRRRFLQRGAAIAAAAAAAGVAAASPAGAADGGTMIIGATNNGSNATVLNGSAFNVRKDASNIGAVRGTNVANNGIGLYGIAGNSANSGVGVLGSAAQGTGVKGQSPYGVGVHGEAGSTSLAGIGVLGSSGIGAQLRLVPNSLASPPAGSWSQGSFVARGGELWYATSTGANPAWVRLSSVLQPLPSPVRAYDSRPGTLPATGPKTPITTGVERDIDLTGGSLLPTAAKAAYINLTCVNTSAQGGFLKAFRNGAPNPSASNINWWTTGQIIANTTLVALDAGGLITIRCGGTSAQTDFIVDILGFTL